MPILPIPSLQALVTKVVKTVKATVPNAPKRTEQRHVMHYVLKGLGKLPTPVLESLNHYLKSPTAAQYSHADAHLRLILGLNHKLKQPLDLTKLGQLRQKFATDIVDMQSPKVWRQANKNSNSKNKDSRNDDMHNKEKLYPVSWQDKVIADADDGDMTVRCYQAGAVHERDNGFSDKHNPNKVVILFFHGGGFCIGDVDTHQEFCHTVCAQTGWAVVSVDYRLAPEYPAPTALRDCIAAYKWLAEHCHTLGVLPSRIVLSGDSAGGCLAILVAQQVTAPNINQWLNLGLDAKTMVDLLQELPRPLAQLPFYPVTDIEADYPSWSLYGDGLLLDYDDIEVFDAAYMQDSPLAQSHALISPMHGNNSHTCPSYIVAAELDILRDEALAYATQLQVDGIEVQTHTVLGAPHGFIHLMSVHDELNCETGYIINEFVDFVRQLLVTPAP